MNTPSPKKTWPCFTPGNSELGRSLRRFAAYIVIGSGAMFSCADLRADVIALYTGGLYTNAAGFYLGQSFTTPATSPVFNIAFNYFSDFSGTTPFASGTGFLLSTQYLGTPTALNAATPGFLGQAAAAGGFYTFAPGLTLAPGTEYFFYENAPLPQGSITGGLGAPYAGGREYSAASATSNFVSGGPSDVNFRVTGTLATAIPDLGVTAWLLALNVVGLAIVQRRAALKIRAGTL